MPDPLCLSPQTLKGSTVSFMIYVQDADTAFKRAVDAGAAVKKPVENQFYHIRRKAPSFRAGI